MNIIIGNAGDNVLNGTPDDDAVYGLGGNDILSGGLGNDVLDGGTGVDSMWGGTGNDTYVVDNVADTVNEGANAGVDRVVSSITYTLGANVENLELSGGAPINGTGNALSNYIVGNNANNLLSGLEGDDAVYGLGGNDILSGGLGNDVLDGGTGADRLVGGSDKDTMTGGAGADVFVFRFVSDSPVGTPDVVNDFQGFGVLPGDVIDVSSIDADLITPGNQAFVWVGQQPVHPGELGYSNGNLWGNVFGLPGDITAEFQVAVADPVVVPNDVIL